MGKTDVMAGRVDIVLISAASLTVNGNIPVPSSQLELRNTKRKILSGRKITAKKRLDLQREIVRNFRG